MGPYDTNLKQELRAVGALWLREFKVFQREKSRVVSSLATPFIWIAIVGTGFGASYEPVAGVDYRTWLYPGVLAQAILFGTIFYGLYIVWDKKVDVLKEVLVAPVSRTSIFFGKVVGGSSEAALQSLLILAIGMVLFGVSLKGALLALPFAILLAISFVSVGLFIGSFFDSFEGFQVIASFLMFPLFFLSGALFPVAPLAEKYTWLYVLARANPVTYAVDGLRGATLGLNEMSYLVDLGVLLAFATVMVGLGTWAFKRMKTA